MNWRLNGKWIVVALVATLVLIFVALKSMVPRYLEQRRDLPGGGVRETKDGTLVPTTGGRPSAATSAENPAAAEATRKVGELKEILAAKNDNDPRLDSDFRQIDPELRHQLEVFYGSLPAESLNSRGTVVFLLGRALETSADADFLDLVLNERPCLSVDRCQTKPATPGHEPQSEVTLAYPQIVAARALAKGWGNVRDEDRRARLKGSLQRAAAGGNTALAREAQNALGALHE